MKKIFPVIAIIVFPALILVVGVYLYLTIQAKQLVVFVNNSTQIEAIRYVRHRVDSGFDKRNFVRIMQEKFVLKKALKESEDPVLIYEMGYFMSKLNAYAQALDLFLQLEGSYPDMPYLERSIAYSYQHTGESLKAIAYYKKAFANIPLYYESDAWNIYNNLGFLYMDTGDYQESIKYFDKAMQYDPENPLVYQNIGIVYRELKDFKKAILYQARAVQLKSYPEAHKELGQSYYENGDFDEALDQLKIAIQQRPKYIEAWHTLGMVYDAQNKFDLAEEAYLKCLDLDPDYKIILGNLASINNKMDKYDNAINYAQLALKNDPLSGLGHKQLQIAHAHRDNPNLVVEDFETVRQEAKKLRKQGQELLKNGLYKESFPLLEESLKMNPYDTWACALIAQNYSDMHDYGNAEKYLRRALALNPYDAQAPRILAGILMKTGRTNEAKEIEK